MLCVDKNYTMAEDKLSALEVVDDRSQWIINWAAKLRDILAQFILPLAYGILGALTSIMRELSASIRQTIYSIALGLEYKVKIPLGALAGASVGLILAPNSLNTAFGLSMLGVAFGMGYSVDVFFAVLDGLIARLTQAASGATVAPRPADASASGAEPAAGPQSRPAT